MKPILSNEKLERKEKTRLLQERFIEFNSHRKEIVFDKSRIEIFKGIQKVLDSLSKDQIDHVKGRIKLVDRWITKLIETNYLDD